MDAKKIYTHLYNLLWDITPLKVDCGKLCDGACCKGDEECGMYLFPREEVMFTNEDKWCQIVDSNFYFRDEPVKMLICSGKCNRNKRPLSCRIFPMFADKDGKVRLDIRAKGLCPLVDGNISLSEYNPQFVRNVQKVFNFLNRFKITKDYINETLELINEYSELTNMFS